MNDQGFIKAECLSVESIKGRKVAMVEFSLVTASGAIIHDLGIRGLPVGQELLLAGFELPAEMIAAAENKGSLTTDSKGNITASVPTARVGIKGVPPGKN